MRGKNFQTKVISATKWSSVTELAAKLVVPITNMILARILAPEAFGVLATIIMIMSFADMFTDAGFQKYLVQHKFEDDIEKYMYANVAFWTNFMMSIVIWITILFFREEIAILVGNPGLGNVIAIASIQLVFTSFSSIQMALYRRDFNFKTLFIVRIVAVCLPFVVTIPLALLGLSYWSLIVGAISASISNAIILTIKSKWRPNFYYSFDALKKMLSFSIWSLVEAISIWFTVWIDTLIIGIVLDEYYIGLYKTSTTVVNSLMALITSATVPVLFSALSRLQDDNIRFNELFYKSQRMVSILVFPLGIGIYIFSDLTTDILLGSEWAEASRIIGIWALTSSITIVFGHYCSEVYRAKGKPKLSFIAQLFHLVFLVPAIVIGSKYGFWILVFSRSLIRIQAILVHFVIMKYVIGIPVSNTIRNVIPTLFSALLMGGVGYYLKQIYEGNIWSIVCIIICIVFYFGFLSLFPRMRKENISLMSKLFSKTRLKRNNLRI
ncbi:polysaccharide biosynthesis protein [Bacillus endophyticus]|uniref:lipopolysaccharide biosynthesis protein n=1 Tax=Priestia endophytica TaxID=135735 RepID=UPI0018CF1CF1|nr:lipopolysaccharide biosynthesis protein [Priestia endophytica]MBG9814562.1 polysaccharide biosynthesis protein [Priestia endophytica]